jgi:N6-L-threonylcarbamoyladenine synthase
MAIVLGIESTAHTIGVGIVKNGKVLANQRDMYTTEEGGIIPMESAKHHALVKTQIYEAALDEAGIKEDEINAIAFSQSPGLAPCLIEGMKFAKELSKRLNKPIVGVNHCVAHLEIGRSVGAKDPVMLYASGANTQIIAYESGKYRVFGETLDLGIGNFIDTVARFMGEGFPGGPKIQEMASKSQNYIELPYKVKGMDIALAGIQTKLRQRIESGKYKKEDLAYSLQETVFAMLVEVAERALAHTGKTELLLGGGVACNSRLQEMCKKMCEGRIQKTKMFVPERPFLVDNAAMIAYLGEIMFKAKANVFKPTELDKVDIDAKQRTDDVEVSWKD